MRTAPGFPKRDRIVMTSTEANEIINSATSLVDVLVPLSFGKLMLDPPISIAPKIPGTVKRARIVFAYVDDVVKCTDTNERRQYFRNLINRQNSMFADRAKEEGWAYRSCYSRPVERSVSNGSPASVNWLP